MNDMKVVVELKRDYKHLSEDVIPKYQSVYSAGMDISADIGEDLYVQPYEQVIIPTGLFVKIPEGYEIQIRPRSGLAFKHKITITNSPGTIDADYRGEIKIILMNLGDDTFDIHCGDRIAQMVLKKAPQITWKHVNNLDNSSDRGGGFGSTGVK